MDETKARRYLAEADENIKKAEALISAQERRIGKLDADGHPTAEAEKTLESLKNSLWVLRDIRGQFARLSEQYL
jgi:hypothetical protein